MQSQNLIEIIVRVANKIHKTAQDLPLPPKVESLSFSLVCTGAMTQVLYLC